MTVSTRPSFSSSDCYSRSASVLSNTSMTTTATSVTSKSILKTYFSPTASTFTISSTFSEYQIEHVDTDAIWYRKYFIHKKHPTFVGNVEPFGPVIISLMLDSKTINKDGDVVHWYRYILRSKNWPNNRGVLVGPSTHILLGEPQWDILLKSISRELAPHLKRLITTSQLSAELLSLDENRLQKSYKIGVLYCAQSQVTEEEWFSNITPSYVFSEFLENLGKKVRLKGFQGFSGGLDTTTDGTGRYSIHDCDTFQNYEIMYHVSTMLPHENSNKHQITKKRHIGNDIVCIVFQDVAQQFSPFAIRSQFLHIYVVVSPVEKEFGMEGYRVDIVCKDGVPYFGPPLPNPPVFKDPISLRKFLVATVINGQNAAWKTQKLFEPFQRARCGIIRNIVDKYIYTNGSLSSQSKKLSQDELNNKLKELFVDQLKYKGDPPDVLTVKELLDKGANPNIRIPQPKLKESSLTSEISISLSNNNLLSPSNNLLLPPSNNSSSSPSNNSSSLPSNNSSSLPSNNSSSLPSNNSSSSPSISTHSIRKVASSSSIKLSSSSSSPKLTPLTPSRSFRSQHSLIKLPNILFATIALTDDPVYIKFLINYGVETMPKDSHFPNAFVFAATHKRVETMRCLLENIPALSDPKSVDTALNDTYNDSVGNVKKIQNNGYANKIMCSFNRFKDQIRGR